ncbi:hypothetical protein TNCV_2071331 [Trichonephila clavipes]|uniref:Uncharacterized protein n=1 Tax=Trichonephila clavipes TaxID=2585209 RepID=A0A8X7BDK0_TRICX|nr:hypothetical protein TNCV_2071331 [Trichonephila clavipes]
MVSDKGLRNSSRQTARRTPVVSRSFEHHAGDSTIWFRSSPIMRENILKMVRALSPPLPFHQPHERTCGSTTIWSTPKPQWHYTSASQTFKHPCLLRDSKSSPTALTTTLDSQLIIVLKLFIRIS